MAERSDRQGFWRTAPGLLTAFAGVLTAIAGLVAVLTDAGVLGPDLRLQPEVIAEAETAGSALRERGGASREAIDITGTWTATVAYPWGVTTEETFRFAVHRGRLLGSASYLGTSRALVEPELRGRRIFFGTRVEELSGAQSSSYENRYDGLITARGIDFRLFDSRGRGPIEFTMRRE